MAELRRGMALAESLDVPDLVTNIGIATLQVGDDDAALRWHDRQLDDARRSAAVLQTILDLGIEPHDLAALTLVPLVSTAWANGDVTPAERDAALIAAEREGVSKESGAHALLESWLDEPPEPPLLDEPPEPPLLDEPPLPPLSPPPEPPSPSSSSPPEAGLQAVRWPAERTKNAQHP